MSEHVLDRVGIPIPEELALGPAVTEPTTTDPTTAGPAPSSPPREGSGGIDEAALHSEIAGAILSVVRQYTGIKARLVDTPEGEMHLAVLLGTVAAHGPLRASDLADRICADPSTVSRQVATLVRTGLLERRADPDDGRASLLVVTDAGRERLAEHQVRRGRATAPVLADWSLHDRTELLRLISRYAADLHDHREEIVGLLAGATRTTSAAAVPTAGTPTPVGNTTNERITAPTRTTGTEEDR